MTRRRARAITRSSVILVLVACAIVVDATRIIVVPTIIVTILIRTTTIVRVASIIRAIVCRWRWWARLGCGIVWSILAVRLLLIRFDLTLDQSMLTFAFLDSCAIGCGAIRWCASRRGRGGRIRSCVRTRVRDNGRSRLRICTTARHAAAERRGCRCRSGRTCRRCICKFRMVGLSRAIHVACSLTDTP